jgi:hypothetical protein
MLMALPGTAFLALWNDHRPERADYNMWHTREHVGERLGIPGILAVRRYVDGEGVLPRYFTHYSLAAIDVLASEPYRQILANPTAWSSSMRTDLYALLRRGCRTVASIGAGVGGFAAVAMPVLTAATATEGGAIAGLIESIGALAPNSAVHLGRIDQGVQGVPFPVAEPAVPADANAVLIVEGYDEPSFKAGIAAIAQLCAASGICAMTPDFTIYRLSFALDTAERGAMISFRREE